MPMTRTRKADEVKILNERFANDRIVILAQNEGLEANEMNALRSEYTKNEVKFKIVKNTLARRALVGTPYEHLADKFTGPVGMASAEDSVAAAKVTYEFAKGHKKFVVLAGGIGALALDAAGVEQLAKLPSLDELRSKLIGLLQAPATKLARISQAPAAQLARVVGAHAAKGE